MCVRWAAQGVLVFQKGNRVLLCDMFLKKKKKCSKDNSGVLKLCILLLFFSICSNYNNQRLNKLNFTCLQGLSFIRNTNIGRWICLFTLNTNGKLSKPHSSSDLPSWHTPELIGTEAGCDQVSHSRSVWFVMICPPNSLWWNIKGKTSGLWSLARICSVENQPSFSAGWTAVVASRPDGRRGN